MEKNIQLRKRELVAWPWERYADVPLHLQKVRVETRFSEIIKLYVRETNVKDSDDLLAKLLKGQLLQISPKIPQQKKKSWLHFFRNDFANTKMPLKNYFSRYCSTQSCFIKV